MENASKALIIAGEVIIALLVISLMVSIFFAFGNFSSNMHKKLSDEQIIKFNNNFTQFDGRINITAQDIVTTINFVKHANDARELEYSTMETSPYYIAVMVDSKDVFHSATFVDDEIDYNTNLPQILNKFLNDYNKFYFYVNVKGDGPNPIEKVAETATEISGYKYIHISNSLKVKYKPEDNGDITFDNNVNGTGLVKKIIFHEVDPTMFNITDQ